MDFLDDFGHSEYVAGAEFLTLRDRDLPSHLAGTRIADAARRAVAVKSSDGKIMTVYKTSDPCRLVRRKRGSG